MKVTSIRFNLKFFNADGGEEVVRSLDDLGSKFNLSDLYDYFKAGDLARWLTSINRQELAEAVVTVSGKTSSHDQVCGLRDVLNLPIDNTEVDQFVSLLERQNQLREKKSSTTLSSKVSKSYIELLNDVFATSDFKTAKKLLSVFVGNDEYEERFLQYAMRCITDSSFSAERYSNPSVWLAIFGKNNWRKYLYHAVYPHFKLFYRCYANKSEDEISINDIHGAIRLMDLDGELFDICTAPSTGLDHFRERILRDPYGCGSWEALGVYDELGNPIDKLGSVINNYISW